MGFEFGEILFYAQALQYAGCVTVISEISFL